MAEPGCGAQFQAAVRVIQGLPRSGSYRPSYEEMLRFYSYYKQATAGRCQEPRPGFWDPIGRYKWDAWHSLGRMSREEAMAAYVAEMKKVAQKIIATLRPDETTQEMFRYFEPLYEVIRDMPRPPEGFFRRPGDEQEQPAEHGQEERVNGPAPERPEDALPREQQDGQQTPGARPAPAADTRQGSQGTSDSEGEVFCDTMEQMEPEQAGQLLAERGLPKSAPAGCVAGRAERGEGRRREGSGGADLAARGSDRDLQLTGAEEDAGSPAEPTAVEQQLLPELDAHVAGTVRALQDDMQRVLERLSELELLTSAKDAPGADPGELLAVQVSGVGGSAAQSLSACSRRPGGSVTSAVLLGAVTGLGRGPSAGEQEVAVGQAAGTGVRNASPCNSVPVPRP
ncbi:acyl-CoA-binding domain-containing protein 4 isoform X1 [Tympanuchus pallidicinctus]|uniref:acyl-CoA-binding domain-containing protein 4 isoform X1 n=1 Tax=Tympanuchus pallidicinctus TaxID=109042 RepID=UPI00228737FE|nr:acyl-CoA-binding domain-containing protein 4 isoform X1 [Tympanuchus pallidicinctus]